MGQQLAEGVALARSAQVMEIQDMGYEVNEWDKSRKDIEVYNVGLVEEQIISREIVNWVMTMMINLMDMTEKLVTCTILCDRIRCNK